jgi:RNA polymerase sigma-70 factor (ECF subfamily)
LADRLTNLLDLLRRHGPRLLSLLTRLTLHSDVAEDLLQELFLKLRDSVAFATARDADAYVTQVAVHLAFDWRRREKRRSAINTVEAEPPMPEASPLVGLVQREELEQVLQALERLSPLIRTCIVLRHLQQESYDDVARQLGRTPHQARALCSKGLSQLRQLLGASATTPGDPSHDRSV